MEHHPDRNQHDPKSEARFKEVNEAYDVLKDGQKKAAYDRFGHAAFENGHGASAGGFRPGQGGDFASAFSDVFDDLFGDFMGGAAGARARGQRAARGSDLRYNLRMTLEEAYHGKQATITVPSSAACEVCHGTGAEGGAEPATCPTCSGHGKVRAQQGFFTVERTCPTCGGRGQIIKNPCKSLRRRRPGAQGPHAQRQHSGRCRDRHADPPGRRGRGRPARRAGGRSLHLHRGRGAPDLRARQPEPLLPHPGLDDDGGARRRDRRADARRRQDAGARCRPGVQSGKQLRLRGKGMPALRGAGAGDLYIELAVETPVNLSARQRDLLKEFEEAGARQQPGDPGLLLAR